ncbi:MAG TPA: ATP-binding protein [Vicinamibacterales bacterium]|jgi:two-component system sensor histidine kinase PilS (NtrC family)
MKDRTLRRRLAVHIAVRLLVATVLLGAAVIVQVRTPGALPINPFFSLVALTYAVSLGFIASLRFVERQPWLTDVHFAIDAIVISAAVYITGGIESLFAILYMLPIVAASTVQFRRGGLQLAGLSTILFFGVVVAQYLNASPAAKSDLPAVYVAQYIVALNAFGFFVVAVLSGSLAERARRGEARLEEATEEIADLQAFNQYVLDNLHSGLATADSDNNLLTFNRSAMMITGRDGPLPIGQPAAEVLQLPPAFAATLRFELGRARAKRSDYMYQRPGKTAIEIGLSAAVLPLPDGSRGFLYTFQDVTDIKRYEQNSRLQQRLAAVGEMAAGIAHEIRNPLASMSGSMQMLKQELPLSADQAQLMDIVLKESDRLNRTIKSFLAYARPQRFSPLPLDLRELVQETATLLRNSPEVDDRHQIETDLDDREVRVDADEGQIRQIIWNLATNGLRAMPNGGTLRISAVQEPTAVGPLAVLQVEDEGVGIPPEEVDSIFQPFRGSFGKGTGLGLAIVHRIVTDYGGRIDVKPRTGGGTVFRVTFPDHVDTPIERQAS